MNIRPMNSQDVPLLAAWIKTIPLWQRYGVTFDSVSKSLNQALMRGHLLLTADGDRPACGFAWCVPDGAFGRSAYLRLIGVQPDVTRAGVGSRLLAEVEMQIATPDLFLLVSDFNDEAQRFYQRHGFEQVGAIPNYVLHGVTELIYRKRVGAS